jgi:hypothetical protein
MIYQIRCQTQFDITATGVRSYFTESRLPFQDNVGRKIEDLKSWTWSRNQQRNWETINQLISLRTLPENITVPRLNKHIQQWEFEFDVLNIESISLDSDPVGALIRDCHDVPMILGLLESPGTHPVLITQGADINTKFIVLTDK